ncbi:TetR/AcrR family transcriptional regulator [Frondihabitans australicus]|uniref:TetR family transcriptional regulator n=1 Tax=Frondihabitans australicus TaxID=386892 RepID=A0A495ICZ8_9MICO|nr:TetR/AcrR family transcriptional regulator [Frondihabitans australicus]RKR73883.1 TetR family transcriptional regulator [Frondihabitans australicus]
MPPETMTTRRTRSDSQRNLAALLDAAKRVFTTSGVDAPVREVAAAAGVGVGTLYRHFPQRSDLVIAVFRHEIDACAAAADEFAESLGPADALIAWLHRYSGFIATKHGLSAALHSGDPAFEPLPDYFMSNLGPALTRLLDRAVGAGEIRPDVSVDDLISTVRELSGVGSSEMVARMVDVFADGLRVRV